MSGKPTYTSAVQTGDFPAPPDCRAILDAIKAEIRGEIECDVDRLGEDPTPWMKGVAHGVTSGLRLALAIIEKHEKENGG